jgi:glycogen debranching enzyme
MINGRMRVLASLAKPWAACALFFVLLATSSLAAEYTGNIQIDVSQVPFSRYGSYIAFSHLKQGALGEGLYLRSMHGGVRQEVFKIELIQNGQPVNFRETADPIVLRLQSQDGDGAEICIVEPYQVRLRGHGVGIRFTKMPNEGGYGFEIAPNEWEWNGQAQDIKMMFIAQQGSMRGVSEWNGTGSTNAYFEFDSGGAKNLFEGTIIEFRGSRRRVEPEMSFEQAQARVRKEYAEWLRGMPSVPKGFQNAAELAAYVDWSAVVAPEGYLQRPAMLMSKNWMNAVWSWDHCFNAMALYEGNPRAAWNQYMLMFDAQNQQGAIPDRMTDREKLWAFSKPPIHGWVLSWMMAHGNSVSRKQLEEVYGPLSKWTNWFFEFRDEDHDGLPEYQHGNDSGWDNSTVFRKNPVVESPDLASFLVIQMETLSEVAEKLGRERESVRWKERAKELLNNLLKTFWKDDHFIAREFPGHQEISADSLLLYIPLILGKQLPEEARKRLIEDLNRPGRFLTPNGLATESLSSPYYEADGYWRGPIWAPSTMILVSGLEASGEPEFARELKLRFCQMAAKSGFAENYDARSGTGLRDPDYTWSASVFLIFAHELSQERSKNTGNTGNPY